MHLKQRVVAAFETEFGAPPQFLVRAPGRVNLIGEHTDYNDGFVLPMAIDRFVWIALESRPDTQVEVKSLDFTSTQAFDLSDYSSDESQWSEYVKGMAWAMQQAGHSLRGWQGVMSGDIPIGAGLSSSAALELATARAFAAVSNIAWNPIEMALLGQKAENQWVGVNCGIMDQMISAAGKNDHALLIDCRSLDTEVVALPSQSNVVVLDTATRRGLVDSAYNERRSQCEEAAAYFGAKALRDVSLQELEAGASGLDSMTLRRARHVITENQRTLAAVAAMRRDDVQTLGGLMNASHASLRDDFEVSSGELNLMVDLAQSLDDCYGARMTGAGFGGCAVALVKSDSVKTFATAVTRHYRQQTRLEPGVYICQATNGAELIEIA